MLHSYARFVLNPDFDLSPENPHPEPGTPTIMLPGSVSLPHIRSAVTVHSVIAAWAELILWARMSSQRRFEGPSLVLLVLVGDRLLRVATTVFTGRVCAA